MLFKRQTLRWSLPFFASILLVGIAAWQLGYAGHRTAAERLHDAVVDGAREFNRLTIIGVSDLAADGMLAAALSHAELSVDPGIDSHLVDSLLNQVETVVRLRFVDNDAAAYRDWRLASGCRWRPLAELDRYTHVLKDYDVVFGTPPPEGARIEDLYFRYWEKTPTLFNGGSSLTGIAAERAGLSVRVGYSQSRHEPRVLLAGDLGTRLWYGPRSASMRRWFDLPTEPRRIVEEHGRVLLAQVGIVSAWAAGPRRPLILSFFFDPARGRWYLWLMNQNNFDSSRVVIAPLEY